MAVRLILGDDPVLVGEAVSKAVDELIGEGDRSLMLETLTEAEYRTEEGTFEPARLIDAARTPPFLTDKRVVVGRHASRWARPEHLSAITELLGEPLDSTDLVIVWERGVDPKVDRMPSLPKALKEAVEVAGGTVQQTSVPRGKGASAWLREHLGSSTLEFDRTAVAAIETLIGEDRGRVVGLLRTLEGALGPDATVTSDDVAVYGGDNLGSAVTWTLDDAIDKGDIAAALKVLTRLIEYDGTLSERNGAAFRLLGMLHRRYANMLRLDGAGVFNEAEAAKLLGMKGSTFPAKKAMQQSRSLGTFKLARAIELLATADLQLRGTVDWPPELVMEVLVARLSNLSHRSNR
ncbi:MAG: hypothetical protein F4Y27_04845 [Acidimicrobiaceae bacterium]|nr:hypothetical protein [Acidimicrobiaceae bacterium]MYG55894.1 hypothetical protein [Acidimicrobiaceae bacterium]MYJ99503.1 hypothetical protein [Acidimicrobiaceae bacterium]